MNRYDLYYHTMTEKMKDQALRQRAVDVKLSGLIGVAIGLAGISALIFRDSQGLTTGWAGLVLYLALGIASLFLATIIMSLRALLPYPGLRNPNLDILQAHVEDAERCDSEVVKWVGDELKKTIKNNESIIRSKQLYAGWGAAALGLMALVTLIFAILTSLA